MAVSGLAKEAVTGTAPALMALADRYRSTAFLDTCLRGVGMCGFLSNPLTGAVLLMTVWVSSAWLGLCVTVGLVAASATAWVLGLDEQQRRLGLYGYNGALLGAGVGTFLEPRWDAVVLVWAAVGAAVTVPVLAALMRFMTHIWGVRPLVLPFNLVLTALAGGLAQTRYGHVSSLIGLRPVARPDLVDTALRASPAGPAVGRLVGFAESVVHGIGQLLFLPGTLSGGLVLLGLVACSRLTAALALLGSSASVLTAMLLGADGFLIHYGLVGLNGFLTCVAIAGVFLRTTLASVALGIAGACGSTVLLLALAPLVALLGMPSAMSLPFCLIVPMIVVLKDVSSRVRGVGLPESLATVAEQQRNRPPEVPATGPAQRGFTEGAVS